MEKQYLTIDNRRVELGEDRNLLELVRRTGIELPTFCYHSELSVYGACRLCIVDIEGMGVVTSCSTVPQAGMVVRTNTQQLREMRKMYLQLLLANHHQSCTTCPKSRHCKLQALAQRMGVTDVPFQTTTPDKPVDESNPSLVRDPNKCVLCGDCVRACHEIQGVGAIDFAHRGARTMVVPAFGKDLGCVECVYCGLCASVCPTGAIVPKPEIDKVYAALEDREKVVVAQVAPAVRVALGEMFGLPAGTATMGKIVAALKQMGFDQVYDTSFAADLTVMEETHEFLGRLAGGERLPLFTSCCPGWVKFAEQYYPELLENVSSCRSPQQMFGAVAKETLPKALNTTAKDLYIVSIMPCTAKKFEAGRPEFAKDGVRDVDAVITTQELGRMIEAAGIVFGELPNESLDLPLGFKTGAGVIFGTTGGVSEAVLRYASEVVNGVQPESIDFEAVRGNEGIREARILADGREIRLAIVHGLKNARLIAEQVKAGTCKYDFVEIMACPGGCVAGAGQPVAWDGRAREQRKQGLYDNDKTLQLHRSQDNPYVAKCYKETLGEVGGHKARELLHTEYSNRKRIEGAELSVSEGEPQEKVPVRVCLGTSCFLRGSQDVLRQLMQHLHENGLEDRVDVKASFCFEACNKGPTLQIGDTVMHKCTLEKAKELVEENLARAGAV